MKPETAALMGILLLIVVMSGCIGQQTSESGDKYEQVADGLPQRTVKNSDCGVAEDDTYYFYYQHRCNTKSWMDENYPTGCFMMCEWGYTKQPHQHDYIHYVTSTNDTIKIRFPEDFTITQNSTAVYGITVNATGDWNLGPLTYGSIHRNPIQTKLNNTPHPNGKINVSRCITYSTVRYPELSYDRLKVECSDICFILCGEAGG